jgi:hypothetical protein
MCDKCKDYKDKVVQVNCRDYGGKGKCGWDCQFYDQTINAGLPKCYLKTPNKKYQFCPECGSPLHSPSDSNTIQGKD